MKRIIQPPNVRKVYTVAPSQQQNNQDTHQMNAVKKIHNLLSSGSVTVTGPTSQPSRFMKQTQQTQQQQPQQKFLIQATTNQHHQQQQIVSHQQQVQLGTRCYVCDELPGNNWTLLNESSTTNSHTKFPNKIGQIVGNAFMVIISVEDVLCKRCTTLINHLDRLETDIERVKKNIIDMLYKKYGLSDDETSNIANSLQSPPNKMQKLNTGAVINRRIINDDHQQQQDHQTARKIIVQRPDPIENQLSTLFDGENNSRTTIGNQQQQSGVVHQMKIVTPQQPQPQQQKARAPIKIYKCMSCDFKTTDLKQFQPHYDTCKQQQQNGIHCKTCKKMFPSMQALKQHIAEKHSCGVTVAPVTVIQQQNVDFSCHICNSAFASELIYKKHMEINHPELKPVNEPTVTQLFSCNICQFMTGDKSTYDEHVKKHTNKVKPFKCRLCATRFETREQASIHAKSHQANYFKCGTCSASFTQRELLVKHFETHKPQQQSIIQMQQSQQQQQQQQQPQQQQTVTQITTQKLLQETIDEALRESAENLVESKGIHFFSCNICSLTFIQENYYNQHMETHKKPADQQQKSKNVQIISNVQTNSAATIKTTAAINNSNNFGRQDVRTTSSITTTANNVITHQNQQQNNSISDTDIESIFEKMHSDNKTEDNSENDDGGSGAQIINNVTTSVTPTTTTTNNNNNNTTANDNLVITSQENSVGGITFNITIPQEGLKEEQKTITVSSAVNEEKPPAGIDMPMLDQPEETSESGANQKGDNKKEIKLETEDAARNQIQSGPVSMPSLDDEPSANVKAEQQQGHNESKNQQMVKKEESSTDEQQVEEEHHNVEENQQQHHIEEHHDQQEQQHEIHADQVTMELDEMHNDSGQIKFILNDNGQILQLDNHIITTDADGNQILVQGTDSEQIQQLLQSVGVLQSGDGLDGETLQMIQGDNNQMIIVQQGGEGEDAQLIDASLLNADGHIVIQQDQLPEGTHHAIGEDGVRIPVSVAYTADGQQVVTAVGHEHAEGHVVTTTSGETRTTQDGETYFALEDLMQSEQKTSE